MILNLSFVDSCSVSALLATVAKEYQSHAVEKGLTLSVQRGDTVEPEARLDIHRLIALLRLLVDNAIKFTEQGEVTLGFEHDEVNQRVTVTVHDTGEPIPADVHDKVFEDFYQVETVMHHSHEGVGLGLTMAKMLVVKMHGEIGILPGGEGNTFYVTLPYN